MAVLVAASSQYFELASAVPSDYPFTVCAWFKVNDADTYYTPFAVQDNAVHATFHFLQLTGPDAGDYVLYGARNASTFYGASTTTGYTAGTWHMGVIVGASATDRRVYIDGGSEGANTSSVTPAGLNSTSIGRNGDASPENYVDGKILYVAVYDYAMTLEQVAALYAAGNPLNYDPGVGLVSCWPLTADANDVVGANHMTAYNTPTYDADSPLALPLPAILGATGAFSLQPLQPMRGF